MLILPPWPYPAVAITLIKPLVIPQKIASSHNLQRNFSHEKHHENRMGRSSAALIHFSSFGHDPCLRIMMVFNLILQSCSSGNPWMRSGRSPSRSACRGSMVWTSTTPRRPMCCGRYRGGPSPLWSCCACASCTPASRGSTGIYRWTWAEGDGRLGREETN